MGKAFKRRLPSSVFLLTVECCAPHKRSGLQNPRCLPLMLSSPVGGRGVQWTGHTTAPMSGLAASSVLLVLKAG